MVGQPGRERGRFPVRQQVDRAMSDHIDQHRAIDAATPKREIVDTQHGHWLYGRIR